VNSGGLIDAFDRACREIREDVWSVLADQLVGQAEAAEKAGHTRTTAQLYAITFARPSAWLSNSDPDRLPHLPAGASPAGEGVIPYEGTTVYSKAPTAEDVPARRGAAPARTDTDARIGIIWWLLRPACRGRRGAAGRQKAPHYWGHTDLRACIEFADDGVVEKITAPGADNRQARHRPVASANGHREQDGDNHPP
jgi:hypothetical protein